MKQSGLGEATNEKDVRQIKHEEILLPHFVAVEDKCYFNKPIDPPLTLP